MIINQVLFPVQRNNTVCRRTSSEDASCDCNFRNQVGFRVLSACNFQRKLLKAKSKLLAQVIIQIVKWRLRLRC